MLRIDGYALLDTQRGNPQNGYEKKAATSLHESFVGVILNGHR